MVQLAPVCNTVAGMHTAHNHGKKAHRAYASEHSLEVYNSNNSSVSNRQLRYSHSAAIKLLVALAAVQNRPVLYIAPSGNCRRKTTLAQTANGPYTPGQSIAELNTSTLPQSAV